MKKPNRDNIKYRAISLFRDFEFVNCIAFEMAIRNHDNFQALREVIFHKYSNFKYVHLINQFEDDSDITNELKKEYMTRIGTDSETDVDKIIQYSKNIQLLKSNGIILDEIFKFFSDYEVDKYGNISFPENTKNGLNYLIETQHFTTTPYKISSLLTTVNVKKYVPLEVFGMHTKHADLTMDKEREKLFKDNNKIQKEYGITSLEMVHLNSKQCPDIECFKNHERTEIGFTYQRPKLQFKTNLNALVNLNLALPLSEIEYQLKILKMKLNDLNLHTDINSSANKEIAGDDYYFDTNEYLKKHNRNENYADLFFTYDYYNYMQPIIKRYNKIQNDKFNQEIKNITSRWDLDASDKKAQIDDLKDMRKKLTKQDILIEIEKQIELFPKLNTLRKDLHDTKITEEEYKSEKKRIFKEYISDKQRASKAEKDLTYMQRMIDKLQYKELITGIRNPTKKP